MNRYGLLGSTLLARLSLGIGYLKRGPGEVRKDDAMPGKTKKFGDTVVVALEGAWDFRGCKKIRRLLLDATASAGNVLVDLSHVARADTSAAATLVEALDAARRRSAGFALVAVPPQVMNILECARLNRVFSIHGDLETALAAAPA